MLDEFYPVSETIRAQPRGMWVHSMEFKLREHPAAAAGGSRDSESRLINRLGQLRRNCPGSLPDELLPLVKEVVGFLRKVGRKVDLVNPDPRFWVTARDGRSPRW